MSFLNTLYSHAEQLPAGLKTAIFVYGAWQALKLLYSFLRWVWIYFLRPAPNLHKYKNSWAVITGSSYGIGRAYVNELAKYGINVVLLARSLDRLKEAAADVEKRCNVKTKVIQVDFASNDTGIFDKIYQQLKDLDVSILVNNVGIEPGFVPFSEVPAKIIDESLRVNCATPSHMTRILLPQLKQRGDAHIINLSSTASLLTNPHLVVYGGTKAYNRQFSNNLSVEVAPFGVKVHASTPAFVVSKMSGFTKTSAVVCDEETYVKATLSKLGYYREIIPWVNHHIQISVLGALSWIMDYPSLVKAYANTWEGEVGHLKDVVERRERNRALSAADVQHLQNTRS